MAGAGFDGRIIAALNHRLKNRVGKLAYMMPALQALHTPPDRLEVTIDGATTHATWAIAANASRYGGAFRLAPGTSVLAPGLQVILFRGASTVQRIRELIAVASGNLQGLAKAGSTVEIRPATRVRITANGPVPCQIDGDVFGHTPLDIAANGPAVSLILP
jgi:diacylglycerol kinase family enzyme